MTIAVVPLELAANGLRGWSGLVIFLAIFVGSLLPACRTADEERECPRPWLRAGAGGAS